MHPSLVTPPPYTEPENKMRTRSQARQEGTELQWYNKMNSGEPLVVKGKIPGKAGGRVFILGPEDAEVYPMIETTNPRAGEQGQNPTVLVFSKG